MAILCGLWYGRRLHYRCHATQFQKLNKQGARFKRRLCTRRGTITHESFADVFIYVCMVNA